MDLNQNDSSKPLPRILSPSREEEKAVGNAQRANSERRGSFERPRFQPEPYLYPTYSSKLDKINTKQEEELKLATTLLGEIADKVLSGRPASSSSPERQSDVTSSEVAVERTEQSQDGTVLAEGVVHVEREGYDDRPAGAITPGKKKRGRPPRAAKIEKAIEETGSKTRGRSKGLAPLTALDSAPFSLISSSSFVGEGQSVAKRPRGRPRKVDRDESMNSDGIKKGEELVPGEGELELDLVSAKRSVKVKDQGKWGEHAVSDGAEDFSGDSPVDDEEEEWYGGLQGKDFDERPTKASRRRSSRLAANGKEEGDSEERRSPSDRGRATVHIKVEGEAEQTEERAIERIAASRTPEYGSEDERNSGRVVEDMLKIRNTRSANSTPRNVQGRKKRGDKKGAIKQRAQDSNGEDEDFIDNDGLSFVRINRSRGTRRNPTRGDGRSSGKLNDSEGENEKDQVFCLCRSPADDEFMIGCDVCGEWFHGRCVNIGAEEADEIEMYTCPLCQKKELASNPKSSPPKKDVAVKSVVSDALSELEGQVNEEEQEAIATLLAATGGLFEKERRKRKKQSGKKEPKESKRRKKERETDKKPSRKRKGSGSEKDKESPKNKRIGFIDALTHAALSINKDTPPPTAEAVNTRGAVQQQSFTPQQHQQQQQNQRPLEQSRYSPTAPPPLIPGAHPPSVSSAVPVPSLNINNVHTIQLRDGAGVKLWDYFFDKERADYVLNYLYKDIAWRQNQMEFFGGWYNEPRMVACYGDSGFEYRSNGVVHPHMPWTDALLEIRKRVEDALRCSFNSVFLAKYNSGTDFGSWEAENEQTLGLYNHHNTVTVTFGEDRQFLLRKKSDARVNDNECYELKLQNGSLMLLWGTAIAHYEQALPKTRSQGPSITLTFRHIMSEVPPPVASKGVATNAGPYSPYHNPPSESREAMPRRPDFYDGYPSPPPWVGDIWGRNGELNNVAVGQIFGSLGELIAAGVHTHTISSIAGSKAKGTESVVLSNDGCVRNDNGDVVFFSVPTDIGDGELAGMMLTALERCKGDHSIRLVRSWKVPSSYAPREEGSYRYDGLYKLTSGWLEKAKDGVSDICAFRLERERDQPPLPNPKPPMLADSKEDLESWRFAKLKEFEEEMARKGLMPKGASSSILASILPPRNLPPSPFGAPVPPLAPPSSLPVPARTPAPTSPMWNRTAPPPLAPKGGGGPATATPTWYPPASSTQSSPFPSTAVPASPFHSPVSPPSVLPFPVSYRGNNGGAAPPFLPSPSQSMRQPIYPALNPAPGNSSYMKTSPLTGNTNIINNINNTINVINNINPNTPPSSTKGTGSLNNSNNKGDVDMSIYLPPPSFSLKKGGSRPSEEIDLTDDTHPKSPHLN